MPVYPSEVQSWITPLPHKRRAHVHPNTKRAVAYSISPIPYAQPAERFKRANPLPDSDSPSNNHTAPEEDYSHSCPECPQRPKPKSQISASTSEDCLYLTIWIPASPPPSTSSTEAKWPVMIYLHGGFLQFGSPNDTSPVRMFDATSMNCIIVVPGHRLNAFGFLASKELADEASSLGSTVGNLGFWDQRLAIEWTAKNIASWGGDPGNITLAGLSAGAYGVFHQLAYEVGLPDEQCVIKRAVMHSQGCGLPPVSIREAQMKFDSLLSATDIPRTLSPTEKIQRLRDLPTRTLIEAMYGDGAAPEMYRAITDGVFVRRTLFKELVSGSFAKTLKRRSVRLFIGEVADEQTLYGTVAPPRSRKTLLSRLRMDFPDVCAASVASMYQARLGFPATGDVEGWTKLWGEIFAGLQVVNSARGLLSVLVPTLVPGRDVYRYRIGYRVKCMDESYKGMKGPVHGSDMGIWWYGNASRMGILLEEESIVKGWLDGLAEFVKTGEIRQWETQSVQDIRQLNEEGTVSIVKDERWEDGSKIWRKAVDAWRGKNSLERARL